MRKRRKTPAKNIMHRIYYLIGKSASGKDSILTALLHDKSLKLNEIVQYTTRPRRDGEQEGKEYHFISTEEMDAFGKAGRIVECRTYHTVHGDWHYMMIDDGQVDLKKKDYAAVGTVESYKKVRDYFGADRVVPFYIYVETGERLQRALDRERNHANPKYAEMCRRFLADEKDFDDEHLKDAGLLLDDGTLYNGYENADFDTCMEAIRKHIRAAKNKDRNSAG